MPSQRGQVGIWVAHSISKTLMDTLWAVICMDSSPLLGLRQDLAALNIVEGLPFNNRETARLLVYLQALVVYLVK